MAYNIEDTYLPMDLLKRGNIPFNTNNQLNPAQKASDLLLQGAPIEIIISQTGLTADQIQQLQQEIRRPIPQENQQPPRTGLDSLMAESPTEIETLFDQGMDINEVVNQGLGMVGVPSLNLADAKQELNIAESLQKLGVDADTVSLDEADDLLSKLTTASVAGSMSDADEDLNSQNTIANTLAIADGLTPEDQIEVYKDAAKLFYNTDDLKKLVPEPDKTLPFLVAGASLIQSGENDESWAGALSKAFLGYAGSKKKEEKEFQKTMNSIELKNLQDIKTFSANMYISDRKNKQALEKAMVTADRKPYKVDDQDGVTFLTDQEVGQYQNEFNITPYTEANSKVSEVTIYQDVNRDGIPDDNAPGKVQLLSEDQITKLQNNGALIRSGNQLKNKAYYTVNGVGGMYNPEELSGVISKNPGAQVNKIGTANVVQAKNRFTGELEFVPKSFLLTASGREKYVPVGPQAEVIFDSEGMPIIVKGDAGGLLTDGKRSAIIASSRNLFAETDVKVGNILRTHNKITGILDEAVAAGSQVLFGTTGKALGFAKRLDDEVTQIKTGFSVADSGYEFFNDGNGNGKRDTNEGLMNFAAFEKQFSDSISDTPFGKFLQESGLSKKRINNLVFTLALQSAALNNQKGRDISDKDIERFLNRAGANATSEKEFRILLNDLAVDAIDYGSTIIKSQFDNDTVLGDNPEGNTVGVLTAAFPNKREGFLNQTAFVGTDETLGNYRKRLVNSGQYGLNPNAGAVKNTQDATLRVVSDIGKKQSGYGTATIDEIAIQFKNLYNKDQQKGLGYLSKIRNSLGLDSLEYKELSKYIQDGN